MAKTKILTIPNYANQLKPKKSRQTVLKSIKEWEKGKDKSHLFPDVIKFSKLGRDYILEVSV